MTNLAKDFYEMIETFHSQKEVWDDELDIKIMQQEIEILKNPKLKFPPWGMRYFSPSSVGSDKRELYLKLKGAKRDTQQHLPYQRRWTLLGSNYGSMLQRQLLFIEKHYQRLVGQAPAFIPDRTEEGYPFWENFVKTFKTIRYNNQDVNLFGTPDGILIHQETGKRVGLEIKSKQTTHSKTSEHSMSTFSREHFLQCVCYSLMYGVDTYLIVYGNLSKKNWIMDEDEYKKYPDLRVFEVEITQKDKEEVLEFLSDILNCVDNDIIPEMDIEKFTFNNFKEATAKSLTDEEYEDVKVYATSIIKSGLPQWRKNQVFENFQKLKELRAK